MENKEFENLMDIANEINNSISNNFANYKALKYKDLEILINYIKENCKKISEYKDKLLKEKKLIQKQMDEPLIIDDITDFDDIKISVDILNRKQKENEKMLNCLKINMSKEELMDNLEKIRQEKKKKENDYNIIEDREKKEKDLDENQNNIKIAEIAEGKKIGQFSCNQKKIAILKERITDDIAQVDFYKKLIMEVTNNESNMDERKKQIIKSYEEQLKFFYEDLQISKRELNAKIDESILLDEEIQKIQVDLEVLKSETKAIKNEQKKSEKIISKLKYYNKILNLLIRKSGQKAKLGILDKAQLFIVLNSIKNDSYTSKEKEEIFYKIIQIYNNLGKVGEENIKFINSLNVKNDEVVEINSKFSIISNDKLSVTTRVKNYYDKRKVSKIEKKIEQKNKLIENRLSDLYKAKEFLMTQNVSFNEEYKENSKKLKYVA